MLLDILNASQKLTKVGGWMWNLATREMFWTDEVYRIHGLDPGTIPPGATEHIERSILCYDESDRPIILEAFRRCCEEGTLYDLEFNFTDVNGRRMRIRTAAHAVYENGNIVKVIGNIMDITPTDT
jgi:PAS domain-containing protein